MSDYKKITEWDKSHKLAKVFQKKDKNGDTYFLGEFNFNNTISIRKNTSKWAKEGEWQIEIIPIRFEKGGQDSRQDTRQDTRDNFETVPDRETDGGVPF